MTKEEYLEQLEVFRTKQEELAQLVENLKLSYVEANRKFKDGEKIVVITPEDKHFDKIYPETREIGFIKSAELGWYHNIIYNCVRIRRDGTPSKLPLSIWSNNIIEKYEES